MQPYYKHCILADPDRCVWRLNGKMNLVNRRDKNFKYLLHYSFVSKYSRPNDRILQRQL